jgi:hypothetical protein
VIIGNFGEESAYPNPLIVISTPLLFGVLVSFLAFCCAFVVQTCPT